MTVPAHWAVWSKTAGDSADYRLLDGSEDERSQLEELVRTYQAGNPDAEPGRAGSLPWVTAGPDVTGKRILLAVVDWSDRRDSAGRSITATQLYLLPSSAAVAAGHLELYRAACSRPLPPIPPADLVELAVGPRRDPPEHRDPIWCAAVAALLLETRVVITEPDSGDVVDRLSVIDAVSRMLPAGYRADLSVASWVGTPEQRPHRLCFGPYAEGDLARVRWTAVPTPRTESARRYLKIVTKYLANGGEEELTDYLGAQAGPFSFDSGPHAAVAIVAELNLPDAVLAEIHRGEGIVPRTAEALAQHGPAAFGPDGAEADTVYRFLLAAEPLDGQTLDVLASCWSARVLRSVVTVARAAPAVHRARLASAFVDVAAGSGDLDTYLTELVTSDGLDVPNELVQTCVEAWFTHVDGYPALRRLLLSDVGVGTAVVLVCRDSHPDGLVDLLQWMAAGEQRRPAWLRVLLVAASGTAGVGPDVVEAALQQSPPIAPIAFDIAAKRNRLSALDDVLWRHLMAVIGSAGAQDPARELLLDSVADAIGTARSLRDRSRLDLLLVTAGQLPEALPPHADAARDYARALHVAVEKLGSAASGVTHDRVASAVVRAMLADHGVGRTTAAYVTAAADTQSGHPLPLLASQLADVLARPQGNELLVHLDGTGAPWSRFLLAEPSLARAALAAAVTSAPTDVLARCWAAVVVTAWQSADRSGLHQLTRWPRLLQPDELGALLIATSRAIVDLLRPEVAEQWYRATTDAVVRQRRLGAPAAEVLAAFLRRDNHEEERACRQQLERLTAETAALERELDARRSEAAELERRIEALQRVRAQLGQAGIGSTSQGAEGASWWNRVLAWFSGASG